jgi:hypothetical protein
MSSGDEENPYERVFTMPDYDDGPRGGIANFRGKPHAYSTPFDYAKDYHADFYELRPVDDETLRLALEHNEMSSRWWEAHHAGVAPDDGRRLLPHDRARYDEIAPILASRLAALPDPPIAARGDFRRTPGHEEDRAVGRWLEVKWTLVE